MKLKALFLVLILVIAVFSGCSASSGDTEAPEGMKLLSNEHSSDFTAYIPLSWTQDLDTANLSAVSSVDKSNINITAYDLKADDPRTLEDYWKKYEGDFNSVFSDLEYEEGSPYSFKLSGVDAHKYIYTAKLGDKQYKFMQVVCIKEMRVYVITYTSTPDNYDKNLEDVTKILNNFSFNNK